MNPVLQWIVAAIAGRGSTGLLHGGTALLRSASSVATGGLGNFLFSADKDSGAATARAALAAETVSRVLTVISGLFARMLHRRSFR